MAWPPGGVTLFDQTFTEEDFLDFGYEEAFPDALNKFVLHAASLYNGRSTSSLQVSGGIKVLNTQTGKPWLPGSPLRLAAESSPATNFMDTVVTQYNPSTGALVLEVLGSVGGGTFNAWTLNAGGGGYAISGAISIAQGGTGSNTPAGARAALGLGTSAVLNAYDGNLSAVANAGRVVTLDNTGKLPPLDGSRLTGIAANSVGGLDLANINYRNVRNSVTVAGDAENANVAGLLELATTSGKPSLTWNRNGFRVALGVDDQNWLSTRGGSHGSNWGGIKAGSLLTMGFVQFGVDGSTIAPPGGAQGSLDIGGSKAGYAGLRFVSVARTFMVHSTIQGFYNEGAASWLWYFDNGVLAAGFVPAARVSGLNAASVNFANSAGSAPANGGTATFATYAQGYGGIPLVNRMQVYDGYGNSINNHEGRIQQLEAWRASLGGGGSVSCFPKGTMVEMADGSFRDISTLGTGDLVRGRLDETNEVLAIYETELGPRIFYHLNGELWQTDEHPHWTREGWKCLSPEVYFRDDIGAAFPFLVGRRGEMRREWWTYEGLKNTPLTRLRLGDEVGYLNGFRKLDSIRPMDPGEWTPGTKIYSMVASGSHCIRANGYVVSAFAHDADFDYEAWRPNGQKHEWTRYERPPAGHKLAHAGVLEPTD